MWATSCKGCKPYSHLHLSVTWHMPSMVTHTRNSCSAFNPSNVHAHSSEHTHTPWTHTQSCGSHLCCGTRGAVGSSVACSRALQSWHWEWRERCTFTPPTYNPETRTHNLDYESNSLTIRPRLKETASTQNRHFLNDINNKLSVGYFELKRHRHILGTLILHIIKRGIIGLL